MNAETRLLWDAYLAKAKDLEDAIRALPSERQHVPAVPKAFTPAQTLEHMALVDAYYLPMLEKAKVKGISGPGSGNFIYRMVLNQMRQVKAVGTMGAMTPGDEKPDPDGAAQHWQTVRASLGTYLVAKGPDEAVMKHPLFGRLSPRAIMDLMEAHVGYHRARI